MKPYAVLLKWQVPGGPCNASVQSTLTFTTGNSKEEVENDVRSFMEEKLKEVNGFNLYVDAYLIDKEFAQQAAQCYAD